MKFKDVKIKICGLSRECDIDFANESLPDFVGFIFAESKRKISFEKACSLKKLLSEDIKSVGVFADDSIQNITTLCENGIIDVIQLHGEENNDFIKELKSKINFPVIKAIKALSSEYIFEKSKNDADYILLDSCGKKGFGGSGEVFDWKIIPKIDKPVFIAGGLNIQNVVQSIEETHPFCVDINSGVETNGIKDRKKIVEIIKLIRGIAHEQQ